MSAFGTPVTQYPVVQPELDVTGLTDSTAALTSVTVALNNVAQWGTIQLPPTPFPDGGLVLSDYGWYPWFNLRGSGKKATHVITGTLTTDACIISHARLADYTSNTGYDTLAPEISDMEIDGNHLYDTRTVANGGTGNGFHCVHGPNPNVDDPNYGGSDVSKSYSAPRFLRITIHSSGQDNPDDITFPHSKPGCGLLSEANRHRFYSEDAFVSNSGAEGMAIGGADPVIGQRTDCGSNGTSGTGCAISLSSGTNLIVGGLNCWGPGNTNRNDNCLAFRTNSSSGVMVVGSVFNDTMYLTGDNNQDRSVNITGNQFRPKDATFSANGVPYGTGSNEVNAFIAVDELDVVTITSNDFNLTRKLAFTYNYLLNARNGAHVSFYYSINSDSIERPWFNSSYLPYSIDKDGSGNPMSWVVAIGMDMSETNTGIRINGIGNETLGIGIGGNTLQDDTYVIQIGDPNNRPVQCTVPLIMVGQIVFNKKPQIITANSQVVTISSIFNVVLLKGTGTFGLTSIVLPAAKNDGHMIRISVQVGLTLNTIAWSVAAGGAANASVGLPSTLGAGPAGIWVTYDSNADAWFNLGA